MRDGAREVDPSALADVARGLARAAGRTAAASERFGSRASVAAGPATGAGAVNAASWTALARLTSAAAELAEVLGGLASALRRLAGELPGADPGEADQRAVAAFGRLAARAGLAVAGLPSGIDAGSAPAAVGPVGAAGLAGLAGLAGSAGTAPGSAGGAGSAAPGEPAVRAALAVLIVLVACGPLDDKGLAAIEALLRRLGAAQRRSMLAGVPPRTWLALGRQVGSDQADNRLDRATRLRVSGLIAASVPAAMLGALVRDFPSTNPVLPAGLVYRDPLAPLGLDPAREDDVDQGVLRDCFLLAPLAGLARRHPAVIGANMRPNPNGTVTVTFFRDGVPLAVTVTRDLPYDPVAGRFPYERPRPPGGRPARTWPAVYEKAYAVLRGSYRALDGGRADEAMGELTGTGVERWNPDHHRAGELRRRLDSGYVVTVSSAGQPVLGLFGKDHGPLVERHEYVVDAVSASGEVTLRSPWGPWAVTTMPWSRLRTHLTAVTLGGAPT